MSRQSFSDPRPAPSASTTYRVARHGRVIQSGHGRHACESCRADVRRFGVPFPAGASTPDALDRRPRLDPAGRPAPLRRVQRAVSSSISRAASRRANSSTSRTACWRCRASATILAADQTDTRNYGVLQGLPELRALLAPLFGATPAQVVLGDNSSLALMHDAIVFALLKGTVGGPRPWVQGAARGVPLPGARLRPALRDLRGLRHRDDPGPARRRRSRHGRRRAPRRGGRGDQGHLVRAEVQQPDRRRLFGRGDRSPGRDEDRRARLPRLLGQRLRRASPDRRAHRDRRACSTACAAHGHPNRAFVFGSTSKITLAGAGVALFAGVGREHRVVPRRGWASARSAATRSTSCATCALCATRPGCWR